jgi:3-methylcrotonyl-CoA carboxylase alpha subunit
MKRILIANRGEIACRIIRTCKRLGIETLAIASEADCRSQHVRDADQAVIIGGAQAKDSYLDVTKIIAVAQSYGVDAVHPGYGFLSENPEFARHLEQAGIKFIGPNVAAIEAMGSKSEAKAIAKAVNVPIIPGYQGSDQSIDRLMAEADRIGLPLLIKATYGGGGKGMRRVNSMAQFVEALESCQREALSAFGQSEVMLERYIDRPRHIEVQIFGDDHGNIVALAERDCSLQRRHQKIIEEAPGFNLSDSLRQALSDAAIKIARHVDYIGAGTIEFLVDQEENYYFLEMNTRLQVEHPVTEMIFGYDLVEWQIRIACGEPLPVTQDQLHPRGHAIEVRLYAEDPDNHFLPSIGTISQFTIPEGSSIRLDTGFDSGDDVTIYYDPMIAKLIVWGENRLAALKAMNKALEQTRIEGVTTNVSFLKRLLMMPHVAYDWIDVGFIDRLVAQGDSHHTPLEVIGLAALWIRSRRQNTGSSPWDISDDWRACRLGETILKLVDGDEIHVIRVQQKEQIWQITVGDYSDKYDVIYVSDTELRIRNQNRIFSLSCHRKGDQIWVGYNHQLYVLNLLDPKHHHGHEGEGQGHLNAPMPGRIISVLAAAGQEVDLGSPLLILEAMKMEHTIRSPYKGVVESIFFSSGDFVEEGTELIKVRAA